VVPCVANTVAVFRNKTQSGATTPSFAGRAGFTTNTPYRVVIADFNGDGKPDLAATTYNYATVSVFLAR
jgi:hypothetical protein